MLPDRRPRAATAHSRRLEEMWEQIGRIMGKLFAEAEEVSFDEFRVVKEQEKGLTSAGNEQVLTRYQFNLINPTP